MLAFRRLDPLNALDLAAFASVFRDAPSFVFATEGRAPTDEDIVKMMNTMPSGYTADDIFIYEISEEENLRGCAFMARDYPTPGTAYLVLLLIIESAQGKSVGRLALRHLESVAKSWGCSSVEAVVDSANERALKFWRREGFVETRRTQVPGLIGQAIAIAKVGL
jgi:ribosomal protein S18 acetylase RimI-like enzyme